MIQKSSREFSSKLDDLARGQNVPGPDGDEINTLPEGGEVELKAGAIHFFA